MPNLKFLVALSSVTVTLTYILFRKLNQKNKSLKEDSKPTEQSDSLISPVKLETSSTNPPALVEHNKNTDQEKQVQPDSVLKSTQPQAIDDPTSIEELKDDLVPGNMLQTEIKTNFSELMQPITEEKMRFNSAGSDNVSPKAATPETGSSCSYVPDSIPNGYFNDPDNDIIEDSPEMYFGKPIPRVLIPNDIWQQIADDSVWTDTFSIPARMGGVLIGRFGKNVRELRSQWKAEFSLNMSPDNQDMLLFKIACPIEYKTEVLNWVSQRFKMRPSRTTIGNPSQLKRHLPFGQATSVQVRSSYGLKEFFVTVPDANFLSFLQMQQEMDADYSNYSKQRMQLCEPVTSGTVTVLPHSQGFARALVLKVFHVWPVKYALYLLLDHGVFGLIQLSELRKIRAKYMRVPFQAIHVSWAHAMPLFNDMPELHLLRSFFSSGQIHASAVRMETCCRASVVFTDLMFVSGASQPNAVDYQAFPPLNQGGMPEPELKMVDILAMCCRAGLYTVVPLVVYPSRQCWLNQSDTPYYAFTGGDIDYQSYVSYVLEDGSVKSASEGGKPKKASRNKKARRKRAAKNQAEDKENQVDANKTVTVEPRPKPVETPSCPEKKSEQMPAKLTMAQIVAMAPLPKPTAPTAKPVPATANGKAKPKPLRSKNVQNAKRQAD